MNNVLRYYGAASSYGAEIPLACAGVISKVNMVFMAICIGISQGCQPIIGYNYGGKDYKRVLETLRKSIVLIFGIGCVFFLCFQLFPRQIIGIFGGGEEAYFRFAERYFRIYMFLTFVNGLHPLISGGFTSIGKARLGAVVSLTRQILFLLPLIVIFPIFFGIDGVMYAGPVSYTHLEKPIEKKRLKWVREFAGYGVKATLDGQEVLAVSYTHLDVYKRQGICSAL